jgi:flagellar basal-body rod modification protein FlgD
MPPITDPAAVTGPYVPAPTTPAPAEQTDIFSSDGFLKILAGQIKGQNPLEPMKDTEFIAQMAQFSQLEQITSLAKDMKALALSGQLSQGASLIGRTVTYLPEGAPAPLTGTVESLRVSGDGRGMSLIVDGVEVDVRRVQAVAP